MTHNEFKTIFDLYFPQVRNYLFFRSGNTEIATDVAQETFLKIWEKQNSIRTEKIKGLLFKIAGDLFVSQYRNQKRSFDFFNHYKIDTENSTPEDVLAYTQLKTDYEKALEKMREKQRTVFLMSRVENLKYAEIAEVLGISVKAVEKRMKGALDFLKTFLKR